MEVVPAIDLMRGKAVRLTRGEPGSAKKYSDNPLKLLEKFCLEGARRVHVVDLDAAMGRGSNFALVKEMARSSSAAVQLGGGIRSTAAAGEALEAGVERIVLGTAAANASLLKQFTDKFGERVWAAADAKGGKIVVKGWQNSTSIGTQKFLEYLDGSAVGGIIVTDVAGDGMLSGVSKKFFADAREATGKKLYASGGVSSLEDLLALREMGFEGAVVGKTIYEGKIGLREAIAVAKNGL